VTSRARARGDARDTASAALRTAILGARADRWRSTIIVAIFSRCGGRIADELLSLQPAADSAEDEMT